MASTGSAAAGLLDMVAPRCRQDQQLRGLAQALRDYRVAATDITAARAWASVDLFPAFLGEDPGLPEPEGAAKWRGRLEGLTQVLVFVPILLAWAGLAFAAFAAKPGESMLQAWEAGSVPGLALRDVALYTAAIVTVLIGLTAVLARRRWRLDKADARLRQELAEALTVAALELSPLRMGITKRIADELDKAAGKLAESASAIEAAGQVASQAQQAASQTQQAATTAVTAVVPALAGVETAAKASRDAAAELGAVPGRLARHLDQITAAAGDVAQADRGLATSVDGAIKRLAGTVATSTSDLAASTSASAAGITAALGGGAGELRDALADVKAAAAGYASQTEVAADLIGRTHQALAALPAAVAGLHDGVSGIGGQIAELTAAIQATKEAAALLLEAVAALRDQPATASFQVEAVSTVRDQPAATVSFQERPANRH
jgi:hypothetical protein